MFDENIAPTMSWTCSVDNWVLVSVEAIVTESAAASVVIVTLDPATRVSVSVVESATTLLWPETAIVSNRF